MKTATLTFVLSFLAAGMAHAADVAVLPVQGTNLTAGEVEAIGVLIANAYAAETKSDVLGPVQVAKAAEGLAPASGDAAVVSALGVKEYVDVTAVQLKTKLTVHAVLRSADGNSLHAVDMTAASLDDMEQVAERIARALVNRTSVVATQTLDNVTANEGRLKNRSASQRVLGLKTGVTLPVASGLQFEPELSFSFDGRWDVGKGFLEFGVGFAAPSGGSGKEGMGGIFAEFGGDYYLVNDSISPYIGGGVIPRIYWGMDDGGMRAAVYAQAGAMFMRQSRTQFYTELRVAQNVLPFSRSRYIYNADGFYGTSTSKDYYPTEFSLNVGIGW